MSANSAIGAGLFVAAATASLFGRSFVKRSATTITAQAAVGVVEIEDCGMVVCAKRGSVPVDVVAGKTYYYCTCGRSDKQPFCDGKHKGTKFAPTKYEATETKTVYFCGCKQGKKQPFCNGDHKSLPEDAVGKKFAPMTSA